MHDYDFLWVQKEKNTHWESIVNDTVVATVGGSFRLRFFLVETWTRSCMVDIALSRDTSLSTLHLKVLYESTLESIKTNELNTPLTSSFRLSQATDPKKPTKHKATDDFQVSSDGKLIIQDNEDEEEQHEPGSKRKRKLGTCPVRRLLEVYCWCWFVRPLISTALRQRVIHRCTYM